jgi:hypothetical protein
MKWEGSDVKRNKDNFVFAFKGHFLLQGKCFFQEKSFLVLNEPSLGVEPVLSRLGIVPAQ